MSGDIFRGEPEPGYIAPWAGTPERERQAAAAIQEQIRHFVGLSRENASRLTREQKGRFVAICWIAQIYKRTDSPKASYVADWDTLPPWPGETDADVFEAIE